MLLLHSYNNSFYEKMDYVDEKSMFLILNAKFLMLNALEHNRH